MKTSSNSFVNKEKYDVIVVGAGHAGCEAALACARMGLNTLLITMNLDTIAQMSCNPAIGGIAKGQIVCEVDALGGEMGKIIDMSGIHFKILNKKKGAAVYSPRAQADKKLYSKKMTVVLENTKNLSLIQDRVEKVLINRYKRVKGILTQRNVEYHSRSVILTTGTFLKGRIHIGRINFESGRYGEFPSNALSDNLKELGFEVGRLKTGTPARISFNSIDFTKLQVQKPDRPPVPFSFTTEKIKNRQIDCYITYTTNKTKKIILRDLKYSPMYGEVKNIKSKGVRYCPAIEDKIFKFPDKEMHQIFLEREGYLTSEVYVNGLSTSLPEHTQVEMIRSIPGLENAEIMRCGYGIEYDFCNPLQLKNTLETKKIKGLYFAGQINGTTGYEEAAGQGLIAGINAGLKIKKEEPLILKRSDGYIGVMIDDLVTKGVDEPYRMFTSRAEYRLLLRMDNADARLTPEGRRIGLIDKERYEKFNEKYSIINGMIKKLKKKSVKPVQFKSNKKLKKLNLKQSIFAADLFKRPEIKFRDIEFISEEYKNLPVLYKKIISYNVKYEGYINKELRSIKKIEKMENTKMPDKIKYKNIKEISYESRIKLDKIRPETLGQASRISGVRSGDIMALYIWLKKKGVI